MTAHHWRTIRSRLIQAGIVDPMALPSMHALLDVTESMVLEAAENKRGRERILDQLYSPSIAGARLNGSGYKPRPAGFSVAEQQAAFDNFARMAAIPDDE